MRSPAAGGCGHPLRRRGGAGGLPSGGIGVGWAAGKQPLEGESRPGGAAESTENSGFTREAFQQPMGSSTTPSKGAGAPMLSDAVQRLPLLGRAAEQPTPRPNRIDPISYPPSRDDPATSSRFAQRCPLRMQHRLLLFAFLSTPRADHSAVVSWRWCSHSNGSTMGIAMS